MLETAFKSSVDVAKAKMVASGVELDVISQTVPLYDSFETQHFGKALRTSRGTIYRGVRQKLLTRLFCFVRFS